MSYEVSFLYALLLTLIIEVPLTFVIVRYFYKKSELKISQIIFISALASALTLPYLWFILPAFVLNRGYYVFFGELLVIFIEAIIYRQLFKIQLKEALALSLVANTGSFFLGKLFYLLV
ncbi:MAG: hypothetical protein WC523_03155 [Patescibacteria group bacterium]|jgi:hypothetical protein